ncbi:SUMF1/EgtB/PvdO family nonheme iron enzyme [Myxococcota bacterium]|nr:SUMF1/EgtB/PvdO family nonheme iron enzyme [Myxococcota bacterium]MBU1409934.1 SUMF1/EgtB/PvdO family nonheme iron enzyme [Myxococcota bacterium]MBU1511607.1 SUMF1/EgtB/PvdO family nonheme iron enzyme [Myxococcota bacterium]PKN27585.1 MAG: hypothetical protein CVU65_01915 [Deltaproteobacteria bacterium HGW-Deltaproteobacteria-22]
MKNRTTLLIVLAVCLMLGGCDTKTKTVDSCGDGFVDPGEQCDGSQMTATTCVELEYYEQTDTLTCRSDCTFDLSVCTGGRCGDGTIQAIHGEQCDGENLAETTCAELGLGGGALGCKDVCKWDVSRCELSAQCGDGVASSPYEPCDGTDLADQTCAAQGFFAGALACKADCTGFDTSGCTNCGDGVVDDGEVCDGENVAQESCELRGWYGGALVCTSDCLSFDEAACEAAGRCGDGMIQATYDESCDGSNLGGATCQSQGYSPRGGTLSCTAACSFNETACMAKSADANLTSLTVTSGTLTPAFSATTTTYTVTVPLAVTSLTVAVTAADGPWATVAVSPSQPMTLSLGANPAMVTVTAESGEQKEYTVMITQAVMDYESPYIGTLIYVPAGMFQRDDMVTNLSVVSAFRMSKYEITRAQWTAVTGWADPSNTTYSSGTSDPVQMVNWYDAIAFCNKLSLAEGLTPVYTVSGVDFTTLTYAQIPTSTNTNWNAATANWAADGYRLPTEMEWMWAAMGADTGAPGVTNTTGYAKAFAGSTGSNLIDNYSWYTTNSSDGTHPAGSKLPNELGLYDLSGNVWEWNWDWNAAYPAGTLTDTRGPASGNVRVGRGGSSFDPGFYCTVAVRNYYNPNYRDGDIGIRVVRN